MEGPTDDGTLTSATQKTQYQLLYHPRIIYTSPKYKIQNIADNFETGTFSIRIMLLPVAHRHPNPKENVIVIRETICCV